MRQPPPIQTPSSGPSPASFASGSLLTQNTFFGAQQTVSGTPTRDLPITLPSLNIAVLRLPVPMTEVDFTTLINSLTLMKGALVHAVTQNDLGCGIDTASITKHSEH